MLTGNQLRICRSILGFTGEEIASQMYVTKQTLSSIETGKTTKQSSIFYYQLFIEKLAVDNEACMQFIRLCDV